MHFKTTYFNDSGVILMEKIYEISCVIRGLGTQLQRQIVKNTKNGRLKSSYKIMVFLIISPIWGSHMNPKFWSSSMGGLGPLFTSVWGFILDPHFPLK